MEVLIILLIATLILSFIPFLLSLSIPAGLRIALLMLLVLLSSFLGFYMKKRLVALLCLVTFIIICAFVWYQNSPASLPPILYTISFVMLAFYLPDVMKGLPVLTFLTGKLILFLVLTLSILAIVAFIAFNFDLLPFREAQIAEFNYYTYYYNPLLGYISIRKFGDIEIGRVAGFMFEPSYLAWFLTTNLFVIGEYFQKKTPLILIVQLIVLLGALSTFSAGTWVVLVLCGLAKVIYYALGKLKLSRKLSNGIVALLLLMTMTGLAVRAVNNQDDGGEGSSSVDDRSARIQSSFFILATSNPLNIILGHSPGYIENSDIGKGESNQYVKLLIEEGVVFMAVVVWFIVSATSDHKYYMIATLLFLNSVVILWTPLFIINISFFKCLRLRKVGK